jgi:hypothetical protein
LDNAKYKTKPDLIIRDQRGVLAIGDVTKQPNAFGDGVLSKLFESLAMIAVKLGNEPKCQLFITDAVFACHVARVVLQVGRRSCDNSGSVPDGGWHL